MDAVTTLLPALGRGDLKALGDLYALLYGDLLRLARARVRRGGETAAFEPAALVHESFLRCARAGAMAIRNREHFLGYAGRVMRSVWVDDARRCGSERRGGGVAHVELDDETSQVADNAAEACPIRRVRESLQALRAVDDRLARVVEMRCFGGMTEVEIAGSLGVAVRTVARDWEKAKAFLQACLR